MKKSEINITDENRTASMDSFKFDALPPAMNGIVRDKTPGPKSHDLTMADNLLNVNAINFNTN